jgi:hypothetical protein
MQLNSAFDNGDLLNNRYHYNLQGQHRVVEEQYLSFLSTIRQWVPTQQLLDQIHVKQSRNIQRRHCDR